MLIDYADWFGTGKQVVVGLSRIPEGKYKTPDGDSANCRVNVYKVLDPINYKKNLVYHLEHVHPVDANVNLVGANLPHELINLLNHTRTTAKPVNKSLIQMFKIPKDKGLTFYNEEPADSVIIRYQMFTSPRDNAPHMIYRDELSLELMDLDVIDQVRAVINSLM